MKFKKRQPVNIHHDDGQRDTGVVLYQRMAPPSFTEVEAVCVRLDSLRQKAGYVGTLFRPEQVYPEDAGSAPIDITSRKHGGSETSVLAYESTPQEERQKQQAKVLAHILAQGTVGRTADEVVHDMDIPLQSISARMSELKAKGMIIDSKCRRLTRMGRQAKVYVHHSLVTADGQFKLGVTHD